MLITFRGVKYPLVDRLANFSALTGEDLAESIFHCRWIDESPSSFSDRKGERFTFKAPNWVNRREDERYSSRYNLGDEYLIWIRNPSLEIESTGYFTLNCDKCAHLYNVSRRILLLPKDLDDTWRDVIDP